MALPLIGAIFALPSVKALIGFSSIFTLGKLYQEYKEQIAEAVNEGLVRFGERYATGKLNDRLEARGIGFRFTNLADIQGTLDDMDRFAAIQLNAKLGTNLLKLRGSTKDDILEEVGRVIAGRVNAETGSHIATVYPVARLREELGTELTRQFSNSGNLAEGGLFPIKQVTQTKAAFLKQVQLYRPVDIPERTPIEELKAAANRARQKKYRQRFKAVYVPR